MNTRKPAKLRKGTIVVPLSYISSFVFPMGASVDTRLRVVEATKGADTRYLCVRDDGRPGEFWIDAENLRVYGGGL